jgi:dihydrofolate reductase
MSSGGGIGLDYDAERDRGRRNDDKGGRRDHHLVGWIHHRAQRRAGPRSRRRWRAIALLGFRRPLELRREPTGEPTGADKELLDGAMARVGAVVGGRNTYESAAAWGGSNPFGLPFFIVTHRPEDAPADAGFTFVNGLDEAISQAREAAGGKDVWVMGGADIIRQALRAGYVEELSISIAPVVLGGGKPLFHDFDMTLSLEHLRVLQSPFATHISYRVV